MSSGPSSSASQPPATQTTPPWNYNGPPIQVVVQSGSTLGRIATRVVLGFAVLAVVVLLMVVIGQRVQYHEYFQTGAGVREKYHSGSQESRNKIAVIRIEGVIVSGDGYVRDQIDRVRDDENVRALVVRVDSPGGTVTGSHYIYHHLRELIAAKEAELGAGEFPVLVSMGSIAASGGYYVSMAVGPQKDAIFAEPTTTTGSIGVILPHYNLGGLMQQYGVESDAVASHPLKEMGSITRAMTEEERRIFQAYIDDAFERFKDVVRYGRPRFQGNDTALDAVATGQIFTADQAKANGLIDDIGYIEEVIATAASRAGLDMETARVVQYKAPPTLIDLIGGNVQSQAPRLDAASLLDLTTPRAYYLMSWLPPLAASN